MTEEQQLKLQSFLDGELTEAEARAMVSLIARDDDAKALHAELKNTRRAIKDSALNVKLPESREFFWSKIARDIERLETRPAAKNTVSFFEYFQRFLKPLTAVAVLFIAGLFAYQQLALNRLGDMETAMADSDAFTYHDYAAGMTLVWLPFPAENDLAQNTSPTTIQ